MHSSSSHHKVTMSPSLLLMLGVSCVAWSTSAYRIEDAEFHFDQFIQRFDRQYANDAEKQARFQIFKENLEKVNQMNMMRDTPSFGITQFMDLTHDEFKNSYKGFNPEQYSGIDPCKVFTDADIPNANAPESFDWREHNAVTPVKNQIPCGSCYAFSTTGNIEGQYAIKHKQMVVLSEQQIVDCYKYVGACLGGSVLHSMQLLIEEGGCETETDYPYVGKVNECHFDARKVQVKLTDCHIYKLTSQEKVKQLLYQNGPISIGIKASGLPQFLTEFGGLSKIITDDECAVGRINHAVLLVGYGTENGEPFWIVKNSWGDSWGEHGYFRMQRGETRSSCGMMNDDMLSAVVA